MADTLSTRAPETTSAQAERTRAALLAAAETVLLRGEEPTMRGVAAEAGMGERTIYRYFETRDVLLDAVALHIAPRVGVPLCETADELEQYAAELFTRFDENRELTVATVTTPWCQSFLGPSRAANLAALTSLLRAAHPSVPEGEIDSAGASLRTVLSGAGWVYQRVSCGLANEAVVDNAVWLLRLVRARLDAAG
jgi:AcrR family transcriptional regulator